MVTPIRQSITINLDVLKSLMLEFVAVRGGDENLLRRLTLSDFLLWLREKEMKDEQNETESKGYPSRA